MRQVKLVVLNEFDVRQGELDITDHQNFPLAITSSIADIKNINKRKGSFSKTFKVPATKKNNKLLNYIYNANVDSASSIPKRRVHVFVNGMLAFMGSLKVKNVGQTLNPSEYELEIRGDNLDWVELMREVCIRDMEFGNPNEGNNPIHTFSKKNVEDSWDGAYDNGWDYVYSLKSYGMWSGVSDTGDTQRYVKVEDMRPDIYLKSIVDQAFEEIDYTYESTFLNSAFAKNLVIPFSGTAFIKDQNEVDNYLFNAFGSFKTHKFQVRKDTDYVTMRYDTDNDLPDYFDNGNHFNLSTGVYTTPIKALYKFNLKGKLEVKGGHVKRMNWIKIRIKDVTDPNNVILLGKDEHIGDYDIKADRDFSITTAARVIPAGHKIKVEVKYKKGYTRKRKKIYIDFEEFEFGNEIELGLLEDDKFEMPTVFPNHCALDVLMGTAQMFNLYFRTDVVSKTVYIETRDTFYKNRTKALNWSEKLDVGRDIRTQFIDSYKRNLQFAFKKDSKDKYVIAKGQERGSDLGSLAMTLPDRFNLGTQKIGTKLFSYTFHAFDETIATGEEFAPKIPSFWNESYRPTKPSYEFNIRILEYRGKVTQVRNGNQAHWYWYNSTGRKSEIPVALDDPKIDYDGPEGLVQQYYKSELATIQDGRVITAYFYLLPSDMLMLDLSRPIYINHHNLHGYYYINKVIDYQPTKTQSTKVELIKVLTGAEVGVDYVSDNWGIDNGNTSSTGGGTVGPGSGTTTGSGIDTANPVIDVTVAGTAVSPTVVDVTVGVSIDPDTVSVDGTTIFPGTVGTTPGTVVFDPGIPVSVNPTIAVTDTTDVDPDIFVYEPVTAVGEAIGNGLVSVSVTTNADGDSFVIGTASVVGMDVGGGLVQITVPDDSLPLNQGLPASGEVASAVLENGTGNWAALDQGSIAFGHGAIAAGAQQTVLGTYNVPSVDTIFQVGAGSSATDRYNGLSLTTDGNFLVQGGYLYTCGGQEILYTSQRTHKGKATRFDKVHLKGN